MSTISYSNAQTIEQEKRRIGHNLDKYAKFYWRGEDMWSTYSTFITSSKGGLKFINGPSFSNEYSSPQYDHATGNLTGVKFNRMQISITICTYGVTVKKYRELIAALGPYQIDYLSFDYDKKLCFLVKTTGLKEGTKTVVGKIKNSSDEYEDVFMIENSITFEVQGEQCALAQQQCIWWSDTNISSSYLPIYAGGGSGESYRSDWLPTSELSFGFVGEVALVNNFTNSPSYINLYMCDKTKTNISDKTDHWILLCSINLSYIRKNWMVSSYTIALASAPSLNSVDYGDSYVNNTNKKYYLCTNNGQDVKTWTESVPPYGLCCMFTENNSTYYQVWDGSAWQNVQIPNEEDRTFRIKYDSASGLIFLSYGNTDYKILNLLTTNTYGEYLVTNLHSKKVKISKNENISNIAFIWEVDQLTFKMENEKPSAMVYGRPKALLL